jgi:ferric-dicitrate binding protein FerR (iron transport regulator)
MSQQHQKLGPPPVDGLSDVSWARVERNVFSRMEGTVTNAVASREVRRDGRSNWVWLAVPAAAAATFGLVFFSMNGSPGSSEGEPSRVVAGASPTTMSFGDAHVTLQASTALVMDQNPAKPTALLENGTAVFAVARGERPPFTVLAGDTTLRAMSAKFTVTRKGEIAELAVESGSVEVRFRGHDMKLAADQTWTSERPSDVVDLIEQKQSPK